MTTVPMDNLTYGRPPRPASRRWPWRAMVTAFALEAALLGLTTAWLAHSRSSDQPARTTAPVMLSMVEPAPAATTAPTMAPIAKPVEPPKPTPAPPKREPARKPDPAHTKNVAPSAQTQTTAETPPIKTVSGADAPAAPTAAPASSTPVPVTSATSGPDERFIAKLRAAVQAAVVYPMALRGMGLSASIDVEFVYVDGGVSNVHVVRPGRVATLDQAAVAAVQRAAMPAPPATLAGAPHVFRVRVIFNEA